LQRSRRVTRSGWNTEVENAAGGTGRLLGRGGPLDLLPLGIAWQTALTALPIYLVIRKWNGTLGTLAAIALTSIILNKTRYDSLRAIA